jgi:adenosylcobinamide-GDP ribazoletransferase
MNSDFQTLLTDTARAIGFLTRLPVPARYFEGYNGKLTQVCRAFPLAGVMAALPAALFLLASPWLNFPPILAAAIAVAISIGTTGALHEDGLADIADGFYGGKDVSQRLEIMQDSRLGTYGVLALIISILIKVSAISSILAIGGLGAALAIIAAAIGGRTALVWHWAELESARPGGTADVAGRPDEQGVSFALISGTALSAAVTVAASGVSAAILSAMLVLIGSIAFVRLCRDKIGGFTGDTLGAATVVAETALLIALACSL